MLYVLSGEINRMLSVLSLCNISGHATRNHRLKILIISKETLFIKIFIFFSFFSIIGITFIREIKLNSCVLNSSSQFKMES